ncbi:MAG: HAMP domain-containing histidine kinase [Clostridia bacterium]|nr:HAMP domain-containing histidine kinase [Clostridia bacterium]
MTISGIILIGLFTVLCVVNYIQTSNSSFDILESVATSEHTDNFFDDEIRHRPGNQGTPTSFGMMKVTVDIGASGELIVRKESSSSFNIQDDVLRDITEEVLKKSANRGYIHGYDLKYYKTDPDITGTISIAFGKSGYERENLIKLIIISIIEVITGLVVVFVISLPVSKAFVAPTEKAWIDQQRFIADVSHELKTPLTVILANNNILLNHKEDKIGDREQWLTSTQEEARQMKHLLEEMLYLAKFDASLLQTEHKRLNLTDLVMETALQFDALAFEKNAEIETVANEEVFVSASDSDLRRLVSILIDNAVKYSYANKKIRVSVKRFRSRAVIEVLNFGPVIPEEEISFIFNRFYRIDKSRAKTAGGFGLGLPIAKEIVDKHGGEIKCESRERDGTTFTVFLPLVD